MSTRKNTDIIYMANYAQTVNVIGCIKTNTTHSVLDAHRPGA